MEVLNDLLGMGLKIYQNSDYFCFSIDSVILGCLSHINLKYKNICDIGTGNGVIPLILSKRFDGNIIGVEIQKDLSSLAIKNVSINNLKNIEIVNSDIRNFAKGDNISKYDLVLCNPPYFDSYSNKTVNKDIHKTIARHANSINLDEIFTCAFQLLKEGSRFATVNRCDNLINVISSLKRNNLEPKYLRFVHDRVDSSPSLFIIEAIKGGKPGMIVDKPFIMHNSDLSNTLEYEKIVGGYFAK